MNENSANLALPTPEQVAWHNMEIGMFIHWAPNVYQDQEYDDLSTPFDQINPSELDTDQWVEVAQSFGAKYIIMVAKHVGGFCVWQTDTCEYGIKNTPWRGGQGDIMLDLYHSCRKKDMKLGVYLSPQDTYNGALQGGRCSSPEKQEQYNNIYRKQLTELLTQYGDMCEVWFDGGQEIEVGDLLEKHAPHAVIFQGKHASIRWVGNEEGIATYPAWNTVKVSPEIEKGLGTIRNGDPNGERWIPLECDTTIRKNWFWTTTNESTLKSLDQLMELYYKSVGNGAVLLLNANPDRSGKIPDADVQRAKQFGDEIKKRFKNPMSSNNGDLTEIEFENVQRIDHVIISEDIQYGERIRLYEVSGFDGTQWLRLCSGTAVGHKRIEFFEPVLLHKIRLDILKAVAEPQIKSFSVYDTGAEVVFSQVRMGSKLQKVGEWGPELFWQKWDGTTIIRYELTDVINDPGQYKIQMIKTNGDPCDIHIARVNLFLNHAEYPHFVSQDPADQQFIVNITGLGQRIELELEMHLRDGQEMNDSGSIWIENVAFNT